MSQYEGRSAFAKRAGVSFQNVTKLLQGRLQAAATQQGKTLMVDLHHPCVTEYLLAKGVAAPGTRGSAPVAKASTSGGPPIRPSNKLPDPETYEAAEHDLSAFTGMTLGEILTRFGSHPAFEGWLKAANTIEQLRERRLKNERAEGKLIEREYVQTHIIGYLDGLHRRLLNDAPKTITRRIFAAVQAGDPVEEIEKKVVDLIGRQIRGSKEQMQRKVDNAN